METRNWKCARPGIFTIFALLFSSFALCPSASAQFIGYSSPQTVNQKVFSGQTTAAVSPASSPFPCTPTNGTPCGIENIGQSIHAITYTIANPCTTGFSMVLHLEATNDGVNWFAISEDAVDQNTSLIQGSGASGLTAIGSYAGYRVNLSQLACASGQSPAVTVFYSGTSTSNPTAVGAFYQSSPYRKVIVQNQPTTSAFASPVTVNVPTGNALGLLIASCYTAATGASVACPSGMTLVISLSIVNGGSSGSGGGNIFWAGTGSYTFPTSGNFPTINMPLAPASSVAFNYAGAGGSAGVNWSVFYLITANPQPSYTVDPCMNPNYGKTSLAISQTASAQLLTGATLSTLQNYWICGWSFSLSGTTPTAQFVHGTGAVCGSNQFVITGAMVPLAGSMINSPGNINLDSVPPSRNFCLLLTGTTPSAQGILTYAVQ